MFEKRNHISDYISRALFIFFFLVCLNAFSTASINKYNEDSKKASITQTIEAAVLVEVDSSLHLNSFTSKVGFLFIETAIYSIRFNCELPQIPHISESNSFTRFFYHHHSAYCEEKITNYFFS